jgi:hypothetical protein
MIVTSQLKRSYADQHNRKEQQLPLTKGLPKEVGSDVIFATQSIAEI